MNSFCPPPITYVLLYTTLYFHPLHSTSPEKITILNSCPIQPYLLFSNLASTSYKQVQRRLTKSIIPDTSLDYKSRLANLKLLPLMYFYEMQDILFFVKSLQDPDDNLNVHSFVSFSRSSRSSRTNKLSHKLCHTTSYRHFYFNRLVRLWNTIPAGTIDLSLSYTSIKKSLKHFFWDHFVRNFNSEYPCSFHVMCPCSNCSHLFK